MFGATLEPYHPNLQAGEYGKIKDWNMNRLGWLVGWAGYGLGAWALGTINSLIPQRQHEAQVASVTRACLAAACRRAEEMTPFAPLAELVDYVVDPVNHVCKCPPQIATNSFR